MDTESFNLERWYDAVRRCSAIDPHHRILLEEHGRLADTEGLVHEVSIWDVAKHHRYANPHGAAVFPYNDVYLARGEALRHKLMVIRKAGLTVDADVYQLTMPPEAR